MRLVVLDTNVIVSAGIGSGAPSRIVNEILEGTVQIALSPSVIDEYQRVVTYARFRKWDFPPTWVEALITLGLRLDEPEAWPDEGPDPEDVKFLAIAHRAGAWLVTGNEKHFPPRIRRGVAILSPRNYVEWLERR